LIKKRELDKQTNKQKGSNESNNHNYHNYDNKFNIRISRLSFALPNIRNANSQDTVVYLSSIINIRTNHRNTIFTQYEMKDREMVVRDFNYVHSGPSHLSSLEIREKNNPLKMIKKDRNMSG
jgi:hypothetical protein